MTAKKTKSLNDMTLEELEALNQELMGQKTALREQQRALAAVLDQKVAEAAAWHKLATMSDAERVALLQLVAPDGIASAEAFGN